MTFGLVLMAALVVGCSAGSSATKTKTGWFGAGAKTGDRVFYAADDGLPVYAEASGSSKLVGRLRAKEKVTRTKEKDGYAYIKARNGALKGWVVNAKLDWRAPAATGAGAAKDGTSPDRGGAAVETPPIADGEAAETGTAEPASAAATPDEEAQADSAAATPDGGIKADSTAATADVQAPPAAPPAAPSKPAARPGSRKGTGASVLDPY